jgi:hypothetical protein
MTDAIGARGCRFEGGGEMALTTFRMSKLAVGRRVSLSVPAKASPNKLSPESQKFFGSFFQKRTFSLR